MKYLGYEVKPLAEVKDVFMPMHITYVDPVTYEISEKTMFIAPDEGYDRDDYFSAHAYQYPLKWTGIKSVFDKTKLTYKSIDWEKDGEDARIYSDGRVILYNGRAFDEKYASQFMDTYKYPLSQISSIGFPLEVDPSATTLSGLFKGMVGLNKVQDLDTKNITDMSEMFMYCEYISILPMYNTSKVTNVNSMFESYDVRDDYRKDFSPGTLRELPAYDFTHVTTASRTFAGRTGLLTVGANFDFSKIEDATEMFKKCYSLSKINDGNKIDLSSIKKAKDMFSECKALRSLTLENVPTVDDASEFITDDAFKTYLGIPDETVVTILSHKSLTAAEARERDFGDKSKLPA